MRRSHLLLCRGRITWYSRERIASVWAGYCAGLEIREIVDFKSASSRKGIPVQIRAAAFNFKMDSKENLEKKVEPKKPEFDPNLSRTNVQNKRAAKAHNLRYCRRRKMYIDSDGALVRDRYGQRL